MWPVLVAVVVISIIIHDLVLVVLHLLSLTCSATPSLPHVLVLFFNRDQNTRHNLPFLLPGTCACALVPAC